MATTTAAITLTSTDLLTDALSLTSTATLYKAGTTNGLTEVGGLSRKTTTATTEYTIFSAADYTDDAAHKLYIKCASTETARYIIVTVGTQVIGRLYGDDWLFMPYNGDQDVKITPGQTDETKAEYMLIYE